MGAKTPFDFQTYLTLLGRFGLIIFIPLLVYFWGTAIVYNLANFWRFVTPSKITQLGESLETPVTQPVLMSLPKAVKEERFNITGFAQEAVQVRLFVNGQEKAITRAGKDGQFSFQAVELDEGENEIYAQAVNSQKIESLPSLKAVVKYLKKPPLLEITNLPERTDIRQKNNLFTIRGRTQPEAAVSLNGAQAFVDGNGNFSYTLALNDGENRILIEALDEAGNKTTLDRTINFFRE